MFSVNTNFTDLLVFFRQHLASQRVIVPFVTGIDL